MGYASPLGKLIHDKAWPRPSGNNEPKVTSTFADHIAGNRNPGLDIGTGRCNDPLYAMEAGIVSLSGLIGTAQVVRVRHANGDESGYAHLSSRAVALGAAVRRGQLIGALGSSGATACHLHLGLKRNGVEIDPWPELEQNEVTDMLKGDNPVPVYNRKGLIKGNNTRFRAGPSTAEPILAEFDVPTEVAPLYEVDGAAVSGNVKWYALFGNTAKGKELGYMHVSTIGELSPIEAADCSAEVLAARKDEKAKTKVLAKAASGAAIDAI